MISTGELRKGLTLLLDGELVKVLDYQHVKQGRGSAFVRLQMRNLRSGANVERTFQAGSKFEDVRLERQVVQFLYRDGDTYHFMNSETFDQITLNEGEVGDVRYYLRENDTVDLLTFRDQPVDLELPTSVVMTVQYTEPGVRGDTATGGTKPATTETGLTVNVPLFVSIGDKIKVDTRTGGYIERA